MSDSPNRSADYEGTLTGADTRVAQFEGPKRTVLGHVQHFLHSHPTMVPVIVLVLSLIVFGILAGDRFSPRSTCR